MISENVMKYAPWSYTMANNAVTCPSAFVRKYIKREPRDEPEAVQTAVGNVVHLILEIVAKGATVGVAYKRALEIFSELPHNVKMDVMTFRDAIEDFARGLEVFRQAHGIKKDFVESKFAVTADFEPCGWNDKKAMLRGKVDLVLVTREKVPRAVTIDHKSGAIKKLEYHDDQLKIYAVLIDAQLRSFGLKSIRSAIHFAGADPLADGTRSLWTPEYAIDVVRTRFREEVSEFLTRAADAANDPVPRKDWLCKFCGYKPSCSVHQ